MVRKINDVSYQKKKNSYVIKYMTFISLVELNKLFHALIIER